MLKKSLLASVAIVALGTGAMAADLPVSVPAAIPASAPVVMNWTGLYVGANLGYTWGRGDVTYTGNPAFLTGVVGPGLAPRSFGLDADGWIGGAQLGYNIQFGQFVAGIEGDVAFSNARDTRSAFSTVGLSSLTSSATTDLNWFASIRGRLGFAFDRVLVYGTGGVAFGEVEGSGAITGSGALAGLAWAGSSKSTRTGWTIGGGAEYAFTQNLSARIEYLYYDLGDLNVSVAPLNAATIASGIAATQRHELSGHIVRAGVNFRF